MGTKYSILQVFYKAFYEYSIRHSTGYSIVKYIYIYRGGILEGILSGILICYCVFN